MFDLMRGEIRKLLTLRTPLGMAATAVLVVVLLTVSTVMSLEQGALSGAMHDQMFYFMASIALSLFSVTLGVRSFTDEFHHGTVVSTFLAQSSRRRVLTAKSITSMLYAFGMTLLALAAMSAVAVALAGVKEGNITVSSSDVAAFLGLGVGMAIWAVIGTAVGALIRSQVAAIVTTLIWVLVVENVASGFLGSAAQFLPGQSVHSLGGVAQATLLADPALAVAVLVGYIAVTATLAVATLEKRDLI